MRIFGLMRAVPLWDRPWKLRWIGRHYQRRPLGVPHAPVACVEVLWGYRERKTHNQPMYVSPQYASYHSLTLVVEWIDDCWSENSASPAVPVQLRIILPPLSTCEVRSNAYVWNARLRNLILLEWHPGVLILCQPSNPNGNWDLMKFWASPVRIWTQK